ncbi:MAG TPA: condensation domain-containing protein, partial [Woeseiaceae bacterium]
SEADKNYVVGKAYERYVVERALIGSPESCEPMVRRLLDLGVTEIACFLDFGVDGERVMANLPLVDSLRARFADTTSSDGLPLSDAQRQLWLLAQLDEGGNLAYNDPAVVEWRGVVDEDVLALVLADVQGRHESLRTTLSEDGRCLRVHQQPLARLVAHDFRSAEEPVDSAQAWIRQVLAEPMSLSDGPLFQPFLLRIADDRSLMLLHAHHIISDGPSMGVLIREIATLYEARAAGQGSQALPAPYQYREFVAWQQAAREGDAMSVHRAYWLEVLTPLPYPLELPYDGARPAIKTWEGSRLRVEADAEFTASVERAARGAGVTTYMFLHAAFSALIHRWSGSEDIVLGVASSGRSVPGTESMVGYGVHLMPARTRITASTRVSDHLRAVKAVLLDAYEHQAYPFAWLLDELDLPRDPSRPPLVNVIFNYERLPAVAKVGALEMRPAVAPVSHARVDLTLTVNQIGNSMEWLLDYNTDLFEARTLERLLEAFRAYLCGFIENPDCRLSGLPLASQAQSVTELSVSRHTADAVPFVPIHRLIEGQAVAVPEAPAVRVLGDPSRTMDFATLNERANVRARQLLELECTH